MCAGCSAVAGNWGEVLVVGAVKAVPALAKVPLSILYAKRLSPAARLLYLHLLQVAASGQGQGWVNLGELATDLGLDREVAQTACNELEDNGLIKTVASRVVSTIGGNVENEPEECHFFLVPLDEVDWTLVGSRWFGVAARAGSAPPPATAAAGTPAGAAMGTPAGDGNAVGSPPRPVPGGHKDGPAPWSGVPDRLLTLEQRVQKYQLEKVLAYAYQQIGPGFTAEQVDMIVGWAEEGSFHFSPGVIQLIIEECVRRGKVHPRYMQKVAESWFKRGIRTEADVARISRLENERWRRYRALARKLNLSRNLTEDEMALCDKWAEEWGFSDEIILAACAETVHAATPTFAYIDAVLGEWRAHGVRTMADVEERRAARAAKGPGQPGSGRAPAATVRPPGSVRGLGRAVGVEEERKRAQDYWGAYYRLVGMEEGLRSDEAKSEADDEGDEEAAWPAKKG